MRKAIKFIRDTLGLNLKGAEIGVGGGGHAKEILEHLQPAKLYLIDTGIFLGSKHNPPATRDDFQEVINLYKTDEKVTTMELDSVEASKQIKDDELDFVYIDANHEYKFIKADVEAWLPKIKKGGILSGHDYSVSDIARAIKETSLPFEVNDTDWWIVK